MNFELVFKILSYAPGPFWLALFLFPDRRWAMRAVDVALIGLSMVYCVLVVPGVPEILPLIAKPEFHSLRAALGTEEGFVAAWNHMIVGDLWIARWVAVDAASNRVSIFVRFPFLLAILFFGPLGLSCYALYRSICLKRFYFSTGQDS